ncbi:sulfate/molybdate ABC transporter ATP-binding protein [Demequina salsinemoris]|uniref:sulfate/molybdate ABC transporter ATP-binding protein n=1 Tax=Demequina salsinemoris TaxID=577470 RepID=UPI000780B0F3|nr:ABC transporter ATP-binding protein [Demequina salsinemoris]
MRLEAALRVPARGVEATIEVPSGTTLALLGPNGAGKSTVLEAIAGIVRAEGLIELDGRALLDGREALPPHRRGVGIVTQDSALFDSLTVRDNVAFGPRSQGASRTASRRIADGWLSRVDVLELAPRKASALSGGQARRVALARALAAEPDLLLLDEPFSALDLESATAMRSLVRRVLDGRTAVLATHEVLDAHALATHVAVVDEGSVVEHGPTARVLERPRTAFAARMAGRSLLTGRWRAGALRLDTGEDVASAPHPESAPAVGAACAVAPRPRELSLVTDGAAGSLADEVRALEPHGDGVRLHCSRVSADVTPEEASSLSLGDRVAFAFTAPPLAYALEV